MQKLITALIAVGGLSTGAAMARDLTITVTNLTNGT
jgi:hypothetical protein